MAAPHTPPAATPPHVVIVLGCRVWPGERPSRSLLRRCRKAAQLWHQGGVDVIIASGGVGTHPPSEAEMIRRVLLSEGIPDTVIRKEDQSTSTLTNARFCLALLVDQPDAKITVVTDGYHRLRTWLIFCDQGRRVRTVSSDDCQPYPRTIVRLKLSVREIAATLRYLLKRNLNR